MGSGDAADIKAEPTPLEMSTPPRARPTEAPRVVPVHGLPGLEVPCPSAAHSTAQQGSKPRVVPVPQHRNTAGAAERRSAAQPRVVPVPQHRNTAAEHPQQRVATQGT